jgi:pSer/pThr/pTyr-binding forkhead associated (FHA) protein
MSKANVIVLKHFEAPKKPGSYARLVCLNGESKGLAYYLNSNRVVLGRADTVDIKVSDIKSSREHAEIVKNSHKFIITDLGSNNGIVVNDLKVKQHALSDGDKIIIGRTVYKFSIVKIDDITKINESKEKQETKKDNAKVVANNPDKRKKILILAFLLVAVFLFLGDDEQVEVEGKRVTDKKKVDLQNLSMSFKRKTKKDKEKQKKMSVYFSRGLREFREGNYFRAMSEFESALSWSPNDPLALFYMRKTKDALNTAVEETFNRGRRDEDSLKYKSASVSYCSVIRLLYRYPKDERYIDAEAKVKALEEKMGLEEGEIECIQKID